MASGTANTNVAPPPLAQDRRTVQVIERQLGRARFHVKLVDLLCHGVLLVVGALVYLLVAAVADHWLLPGGLGFTGRTLAFVGLVVLIGWFVASYFGPLLFRAINPTYAARAIEEAQPSLKNSLINFLLLRQDRGGVREAVFEAVEQKAAADIASVQVESAVDRSPMIRVGYLLVGVLALCAVYKILSPKDPFQTAARVALPWADIARPSRVQILEVTPGNAKVYHGHTVPVTATINGTSEDSPVWLIYSTADGQTVDRKLRMKSRPGGIQFDAQLPPEDGQSPAIKPGLQQDVIYRVEAGDAVTDDYRLAVVAAPTIVVQQLELVYPAYTNKPPQKLDKQGDIQAIEGTKVTIHALANQPITSAFLELDPNDSPLGAAEIMPLEFDGQRAWGTITLKLAKDRVTPWRTSYFVRFINEDGNKSEQPIRHQIDVQRDLPPEVQILAPLERRIEVPENGSRPIDVRAVDPDFGLTSLTLVGEVRGKEALREELLKDDSLPPQAVGRFVLRPQAHGLKAGDELVYHAVAADNRTSPITGESEPNETTTTSQVIVIVAPQQRPMNQDEPPPDVDQPPMQDQNPQGDKPPMPMNDQRQQPSDQQPENDGRKNDQPKEGQKIDRPMEGQPQNKDGSQQGAKNDKSQDSKGDKSDAKGGSPQSDAQKNDGQQGEQQGGQDSREGTKGQSQPGGGKGEKSSGQPQQESPTDGAAGEPSPDGNPTGKPAGNSSKPSGNQFGEPGDASGEPSGTSDQPARPAHDGDAIERINKLRQERQQQSGEPGAKRDGSDQTPPDAVEPREGSEPREPMREGAGSDASEGSKADGAKGEKGSKSGAPKTDGASGEKTGQKGDQKDKSKQPKAGEKSDGQQGEKSEGSDPAGAKAGQKDKAGEKSSAGADKKQGEAGAKNEAGGKGGNPQGPMKIKGDEPQPGEKGTKGEKKEPGMGKTGESGAGDASKDEKGTGDSQEAGRDRPKELTPDSTQPKDSDPSTPAGSKKQSDSKGNDSGDKAGGGKKGAGQPSKQAGNDTAGENSPGDEGAGAASEIGQGPTGNKGGNQQKADGQTGAKGSEKGDGSSGEKGQGDSAGGGAPPKGAKKQDGKSDPSKGDDPGHGSSGHVVGGGNQDDRPRTQIGEKGEVPDSDDANLEYAKKQTELALQYLKDQEHNPDPELLDRLGWTKEEMQEFLRRWDALQKAAAEDPKASHELDESLRSLGIKPAANRKRAGGTASDNARDLRDSGTRTTAPKTYRDQFDNFRKGSR